MKDEDCTIILMGITEVKEEIDEVNESLHKLGRKLGVCLFHVPEVAPMHLVSNVTPPNSIPAIPKGATSLQGFNGLPDFVF